MDVTAEGRVGKRLAGRMGTELGRGPLCGAKNAPVHVSRQKYDYNSTAPQEGVNAYPSRPACSSNRIVVEHDQLDEKTRVDT